MTQAKPVDTKANHDHHDWLQSFYPAVKEAISNAVPDYWSDFRRLLDEFLNAPTLPEAVLPLATCRAVNGSPENAVAVSAALVTAGTCLRILDDLQDQDRPKGLWRQIGIERAWNYASAFQTLTFEIIRQAPLKPEAILKINQCFVKGFFHIIYGQDRDLAGATKTLEDYWLTIDQKIARGYAIGCEVGALVGTEDVDLIQACHQFGYHLGFAIQILNDMESIWLPQGVTDLNRGKVTLPLLYGLSLSHYDRDELQRIVETHEVAHRGDRIQTILDRIGTKDFLIWAALKERDQALKAIRICPNAEGKEALESYITGMFGDIDLLLKQTDE